MPDAPEVTIDGRRISLPTLGAWSSICGVIIFILGWVGGYMTFKADIKIVTDNIIGLRLEGKDLQERVTILNQSLNNDRQASTNRLVGIETDIKYISQAVGANTIRQVPK